ncbi:PH domain-containing protein [Neobacillus niacini]|uniref:PH domain-containing protein n=1 Tax=Neobacillus niacini TaxID=86668 RepID=UPI00052F4B9F|nr:PH domain-containing protein [Neobacillus niacini]KGM46162.1 membrane protein [Neobacillus niacini]MEC1522254.1 PH domain-containing protein [Neobacillus niacini]
MILEPQKRISVKALTVWRISGAIKIAISWILAGVAIYLLHIFKGPFWISPLLIAIELISSYFIIYLLPSLRWKRWRYEVREEEIELQEGIFIVKRTLIPMVRVQHVDTVQGPILRNYQLASVIINTAATAHEIPALEESEAEELRRFISNLARVADEDV